MLGGLTATYAKETLDNQISECSTVEQDEQQRIAQEEGLTRHRAALSRSSAG